MVVGKKMKEGGDGEGGMIKIINVFNISISIHLLLRQDL